MNELTDKDLPGLYRCADQTSLRMQKHHFRGLAIYSFLLVLGGVFNYTADSPEPLPKAISAVLFLIALGMLIWQKIAKLDDLWYNGRAVAESVKTRTWRFALKAVPYDIADTAENRFINDLKEILRQNESLVSKLNISEANNEPISALMKDIRSLSIIDRLEYYKLHRIHDQEQWYVRKAEYNKRKSAVFFAITIVVHSITIGLLIYNIAEPALKFPIAALATAASGLLGWTQAKKYSELQSSYTLTAHEISLLKTEASNSFSEAQLSEYVINCESAFSREHTQWVARKRK